MKKSAKRVLALDKRRKVVWAAAERRHEGYLEASTMEVPASLVLVSTNDECLRRAGACGGLEPC